MSSLFGIVNSIRPFCIFLCIYTFYYVLYSAILTYDILDFCGDVLLFLLGSVKFCKLLCNSTFYALMYVIIQDWVTFGIFVFCFASQYYDLFQLVKLYYAYVISCMALSGQKLDGKQGEWVLFSTTLPFSAIRCLKDGQCRQSCCSQKPPSERIAQYFETESGNGDSDTLDHVQYRLDCLYRLILGCFDAGIVDQRVHSSFHFSLVTDPLFSLQSLLRKHD